MKIDLDNPLKDIAECQEHAPEMKDDCDACVLEFNAKQEVISALSAKIKQTSVLMRQQRVGLPMDLATNIRLEVLIEALLGPRGRSHFEVETGRRMLLAMQAAQRDNVRSSLTVVGDQQKPGLVVP